MGRGRRILIVGPSWVGDMVMAQSLFITLANRHQEAQIDVLAPPWSLPILQRMPEVAHAISMPLEHGQIGLNRRRKLGRDLTGHNYDQAIVLPGSLKSALVPWFAGIPQRTGYTGEMRYFLLNDRRHLDQRALPMTVQRFVALGLQPQPGQAPDIPPPRLMADTENALRLCDRLSLNRSQPAVAFIPGAEYGPAKQWPALHYAELASKLITRGFQVWVLGSKNDQPVGRTIADAVSSKRLYNLCGQTTLADAVDLLSTCDAVVSNDSGLMHVAAGLDKPLLAIYGSTDPKHTPPLNRQAKIVHLGLSCAPCFQRFCPLGHTRCLHDIHPDQVLKALS